MIDDYFDDDFDDDYFPITERERLEAEISRLWTENERLSGELSRALSGWVEAEDRASLRNLQLALVGALPGQKETT